jgi:hypothetical protein
MPHDLGRNHDDHRSAHDPDRPLMTPVAHGRRRRGDAALVGILAVLLVPALVAAHPLGNFTINHYAGVRVEPDRILLDVVIDQAEIPTFQARLAFDTDGDGEVSDAETDAGRETACRTLQADLSVAVDGTLRGLTLEEAGLTFPPGVGGLSTMRIVCGFRATLDGALAAGTRITFADTSWLGRVSLFGGPRGCGGLAVQGMPWNDSETVLDG